MALVLELNRGEKNEVYCKNNDIVTRCGTAPLINNIKGSFPAHEAVMKSVFMVVNEVTKKGPCQSLIGA